MRRIERLRVRTPDGKFVNLLTTLTEADVGLQEIQRASVTVESLGKAACSLGGEERAAARKSIERADMESTFIWARSETALRYLAFRCVKLACEARREREEGGDLSLESKALQAAEEIRRLGNENDRVREEGGVLHSSLADMGGGRTPAGGTPPQVERIDRATWPARGPGSREGGTPSAAGESPTSMKEEANPDLPATES